MLANLEELLHGGTVSVPQGQCKSTEELVAIDVGMAHRKKGHPNLLENAAIKKPAQIAEHHCIFVFPSAIVQLEVKSVGQRSTTFNRFRVESPVQYLCFVECRVR